MRTFLKKRPILFAADDLNDSQVRDLIATALSARAGEDTRCSVQDVNRAKGTCTYTEWDSDYISYPGELYQATFEIADDYTVTLGEGQEVIQTSRYEPAPMDAEDDAEAALMSSRSVHTAYFSLDGAATEAGDYILRSGKVSEVGAYPDKGIAFAADDFDAAVSSFGPVAMDSEHGESLLDGALGTLRRVWRQGRELWGEIALPKELDALFTRKQISRRVSLTWDRPTKRIIGCAWAKYPRVGDAVVMSDERTRSSARDARSSPRAGGTGQRHAPPGQEKSMNLVDKLKAFFKAEGIELDSEGASTAGASVVSAAEFNDLKKRFDELAARSAVVTELQPMELRVAFSESGALTEAVAFADGLITSRRILPGEKRTVVDAYVAALRADYGQAKFTSDNKLIAPTLDAIKAAFTARPEHLLTTELLGTKEVSEEDMALFMSGGKKDEKPMPTASEIYARRKAQMNGRGKE